MRVSFSTVSELNNFMNDVVIPSKVDWVRVYDEENLIQYEINNLFVNNFNNKFYIGISKI